MERRANLFLYSWLEWGATAGGHKISYNVNSCARIEKIVAQLEAKVFVSKYQIKMNTDHSKRNSRLYT